MNFPKCIRTKAEATALAAEVFPNFQDALTRAQVSCSGDDVPYFRIEQQARDDLRELFIWLADPKTRIYKRPRWHLFYELARRLTRLLIENRKAIERHGRMQFAHREGELSKLAHIVSGSGEGI